MRYEYVTQSTIKQHWDFIKFGLNKILRKSPECWIPEDVYAKAIYQQAHIWLVKSENGNTDGFFILEPSGDTCHVWCAWAVESDLLVDGVEQIEKIARETGARRITFDTNRAGWSRVATKLGFIPRTWVKELK